MKRTMFLMLVLGAAVGGAIVHGIHAAKQSQERRIIEQNWKASIKSAADRYYRNQTKVPIPNGLDFSTNSAQQFAFWSAFANCYIATDTNTPLVSRRERRIISDPGFRQDDPEWIAYIDRYLGADLAHEAAVKGQRGMSYGQLVDWVRTNYEYDVTGQERAKAFMEPAEKAK